MSQPLSFQKVVEGLQRVLHDLHDLSEFQAKRPFTGVVLEGVLLQYRDHGPSYWRISIQPAGAPKRSTTSPRRPRRSRGRRVRGGAVRGRGRGGGAGAHARRGVPGGVRRGEEGVVVGFQRFVLDRDVDETGVSGTGVVAEGVRVLGRRRVPALDDRVAVVRSALRPGHGRRSSPSTGTTARHASCTSMRLQSSQRSRIFVIWPSSD